MSHWFDYPHIDPIAFRVGVEFHIGSFTYNPIPVHWYGLSYLFGFICVYLWMNRPEGRRRLGLTSDEIQDFLVYALVGVLVGGRTGFVIADVITRHNLSDYLASPLNFVAIWQGGMAFHGALVGVILAILVFLRKHPLLTFGVLGDEIVPLLSIGIFTTRLVNFINDELPGKLCLPDHPYCILFPAYAGLRYPSQIFEAILDILTLPIILLVYRARPPIGVVTWTWFTLYGITRTIAEIWREPGFTVFGLDGGQFVAVVQIFVGIALLVVAVRRGDPRAGAVKPAAMSLASGTVAERVATMRARVAEVAVASGRERGSVAILAVTKSQPAEAVRAALDAGLTDVGENYVQEARAKYADLPPCTKHFVGHVQTNKAKAIVKAFDVVQSVDRLDAGLALAKAARDAGRRLRVLVQVNVSPTERFGTQPADAPQLAARLRAEGLAVDGVMAIGPLEGDVDAAFATARTAFEAVGGTTLSLGMSDDWERAVRHGSTMVRLGTAIFGPRPAPLRSPA